MKNPNVITKYYQKEGKKPISAKEFLSGYKENNIFFD